VFEIGNSLREARLRQGIDYARVEADTMIRGKYLQALEEERFEVLPGETYVKGFLRTYADYLGLDGQLYVDEFNSRFASADEPPPQPGTRARARTRTVEANFVAVALAGIVAVTLLVVVAWRIGSEPNRDVPLANSPTTTPQAGAEGAQGGSKPAGGKAKLARLVVRASDGDCWLEVRAGSVTGNLLYQGTLEQGQSLRFARKRLWMVVGAGGNLDATVNGKAIELPSNDSVVVVPKGVRRAL
jgi:cytoskeleton protein RodZ